MATCGLGEEHWGCDVAGRHSADLLDPVLIIGLSKVHQVYLSKLGEALIEHRSASLWIRVSMRA